jgi:hypothetical protein
VEDREPTFHAMTCITLAIALASTAAATLPAQAHSTPSQPTYRWSVRDTFACVNREAMGKMYLAFQAGGARGIERIAAPMVKTGECFPINKGQMWGLNKSTEDIEALWCWKRMNDFGPCLYVFPDNLGIRPPKKGKAP